MKKPHLLIITVILCLVLTGSMSLAKDSGAESIDEDKQAAKENSDDATVYFDRGVDYLKSGMYKEAIESLKHVVRINADATSHYNLGFVYGRSGMYKEAIEVYKRAIFINTGYIEAYNNLGKAYGELGMYKEAIEVLKVAIERDPEHAMSYYNLGILYNSSNDKDSALEQHEILNSLDFDLSDQLLGLIQK